VAAPEWADVHRELKRLELMGKVSRGDFIESHRGEQYGLPEAIELLRDCRGRRGEGAEAGYLPEEPLLSLSYNEPANLYASCLELVDEGGEAVQRPRKRGSRLVVQAGLPLLYLHWDEARLLGRMTRRQLAGCIEQLRHSPAGEDVHTEVKRWNGAPVDVHPVCGLLHDMGFSMSGGAMRWPSVGPVAPWVPVEEEGEFLPQALDRDRQRVGPDHALRRAPEAMQPVLRALFPVVEEEFGGESWQLDWGAPSPAARYRGLLGVSIRAAKSYVEVRAHPPGVTRYDKVGEFPFSWGRLRGPEDVNEAFIAELRRRRERTEVIVDAYLTRRGGGQPEVDGEREAKA
jgi:hypothetical protein